MKLPRNILARSFATIEELESISDSLRNRAISNHMSFASLAQKEQEKALRYFLGLQMLTGNNQTRNGLMDTQDPQTWYLTISTEAGFPSQTSSVSWTATPLTLSQKEDKSTSLPQISTSPLTSSPIDGTELQPDDLMHLPDELIAMSTTEDWMSLLESLGPGNNSENSFQQTSWNQN